MIFRRSADGNGDGARAVLTEPRAGSGLDRLSAPARAPQLEQTVLRQCSALYGIKLRYDASASICSDDSLPAMSGIGGPAD
jgi:hypothetical protein